MTWLGLPHVLADMLKVVSAPPAASYGPHHVDKTASIEILPATDPCRPQGGACVSHVAVDRDLVRHRSAEAFIISAVTKLLDGFVEPVFGMHLERAA